MSEHSLIISPISRIKGQMSLELEMDGTKVASAKVAGTSVRGFENLLLDRDPGDLSLITQRVCGSCSVAHAIASCEALEAAWGVSIPTNGRVLRNLALAASTISSHISWFYQSALGDYVDFGAVARYEGGDRDLLSLRERFRALVSSGEGAPFLPQLSGDLIDDPETVAFLFDHALDSYRIRRIADQIIALIGGRMPIASGIIPGGVASRVSTDMLSALVFKFREVASWVNDVMIGDLLDFTPSLARFAELGVSVPNYLTFGAYRLDDVEDVKFFPRGAITGGDTSIVEELSLARMEESVASSYYARTIGDRHPEDGGSAYDLGAEGAYSWVKAPRYGERAMQTGPLARMLMMQDETILGLDRELRVSDSVLGRMIARGVEAGLLSRKAEEWLRDLKKDSPSNVALGDKPAKSGAGMTESPDGALGHWVTLSSDKVDAFQIVGGSTWNASSRDGEGTAGPIEEALIGVEMADPDNPLDVLRVVRSFDPCMRCAVH